MIKAVDRVGIEQNILLGSYVSSNKSIFAFNFHKCSVPIPTNKKIIPLPVTPLCENELRKENRAEILEPLVKGIIYTERVRKNKSNGVKK
tara:strand:+ start:690 stop:959 length:270 start_codon:yes stop_codon:yes gene_type:complete